MSPQCELWGGFNSDENNDGLQIFYDEREREIFPMRSPMHISPNELFKLLGDRSPWSPFGNHKSGKSFVFSLFNFKEKSRCSSELVIRTHFDDLESSNAGKMSVVHYIKARNENHKANLNVKNQSVMNQMCTVIINKAH